MAEQTDLISEELVTLLPRLRRFARGLAGNVDEADDLVQTACEKALRHIHQWRPSTRLDSWMYRIIRNAYLDSLRARKTRTNHVLRVIHGDSSDAVSIDGQHLAEARLTLDVVRQGLATLPEEQRSLLLLVCVEGCSYKEAAEVFGIPPGTVMSRLARGRLALADFVEGGSKTRTRRTMP